MRICNVDGCLRAHKARGLCPLHYQQLQRSDNFTLLDLPTLEERFVAGLVRMPNGCLEWTLGLTSGGYGNIKVDGDRVVRTHRLAWELTHGPIPPGMHVLHHCDNPPCCDAVDTDHHLFLGTNTDNVADRETKGRNGHSTKIHCPQDHPYSGLNLYVNPTTGRRSCKQCKRDYKDRVKRL